MSSRKVLRKFYPQLVTLLPMDNPLFTAELYSHGLLPADARDQIKAKGTRAEKCDYFISHVIIPSLVIDDSHFMELLNIMQQSEFIGVKQLSDQIKSELKKESPDTAG